MLLKTVFIYLIFVYTFLTGDVLNLDRRDIHFHPIHSITYPQQVFWLDLNNIILVKDMDVYVFNLEDESLAKIFERDRNEFVGFNSEKELIICSFEHFIIDSYDDFSTELTFWDGERNVLNTVRVFETVRPIFLYEDIVVVKNALDFLEERYFEIDIYTGEKREINKPNIKNFELKDGFRRVFWFRNMVVLEGLDGELNLARYVDVKRF